MRAGWKENPGSILVPAILVQLKPCLSWVFVTQVSIVPVSFKVVHIGFLLLAIRRVLASKVSPWWVQGGGMRGH